MGSAGCRLIPVVPRRCRSAASGRPCGGEHPRGTVRYHQRQQIFTQSAVPDSRLARNRRRGFGRAPTEVGSPARPRAVPMPPTNSTRPMPGDGLLVHFATIAGPSTTKAQAGGVAHRRRTLDQDGDVEVTDHPADDLKLLEILFAEHRHVGRLAAAAWTPPSRRRRNGRGGTGPHSRRSAPPPWTVVEKPSG